MSSTTSVRTISVTCESDRGRRVFCEADTSRGVRLSKRLSSAPCDLRTSWGFDHDGIWVDKGCRAVFEIGAGGFGGSDGSGTHQPSTITCQSERGRRALCEADTSRGVKLSKRLSSAPCDFGESWGYDRDGIWVDDGCRAVFEIGAGGFGGSDGSHSSTVTCESTDGRRAYCEADTSHGVTLVKRLSTASCDYRLTWGYDRNGIWVINHCRAVFELGAAGTGGDSSQQPHSITCESQKGRRAYCEADTSRGVKLSKRLSSAPCTFRDTWGYDRDGIWVDDGCRAIFRVGDGW